MSVEDAPLSKSRQWVYLDPRTLAAARQYMEASGCGPQQALSELIKLGLGAAPAPTIIESIKRRIWTAVNRQVRRRVSASLIEIGRDVEASSNDPETWET